LPLAVVIDGESASAAEVVSGALRDRRRARSLRTSSAMTTRARRVTTSSRAPSARCARARRAGINANLALRANRAGQVKEALGTARRLPAPGAVVARGESGLHRRPVVPQPGLTRPALTCHSLSS
jgi:hypothetical protein